MRWGQKRAFECVLVLASQDDFLKEEVGKKDGLWKRRFQNSATQPQTRVWKGRRRCLCKIPGTSGFRKPCSSHHVRLAQCERCKKSGSIVRVRSVQLKLSSSLVVCVSVRFRVSTAPRPPSWTPRLVDEAGILETSRILRFNSSCAASCQQAAQHFLPTIVQRNVCPGVRQACPLRASQTLPFGDDRIVTPAS